MNADFLVIGGGISGMSIAAALAGQGSVIVVGQENHLAYPATTSATATFQDSHGDEVVQQLSRYSRPLLESNAPGADATLLLPRGAVHLVPAAMALCNVPANVRRFPQLKPAQVRELIPSIREDAISGGFHEASAADIDVHALYCAYKRRVHAHGGVVVTNARVRRAVRRGKAWWVRFGEWTVSARVVINAAGGWAAEVGATFGIPDPGLRPIKRSAALVKPPPDQDIREWPVAGTITGTVRFKPEAGKLMVSPYEETPRKPRGANDDEGPASGIGRFEQLMAWSAIRVESTCTDLRTLTDDGRPVVGPDSTTRSFFWLAGEGDCGIQTAPAVAALLAAQVLRQRVPSDLVKIVDAVAPGRKSQR